MIDVETKNKVLMELTGGQDSIIGKIRNEFLKIA